MDLTILYLGTPNLDERIRKTCRERLYEARGDAQIVEMHQDASWPISGLSMYKQIAKGLEQVTTPFVAIAEHDCVYSKEHFAFRPPTEHFYYNQNCWLLQYHNPRFPELDGTFSYWAKRRVQSQLICSTEKLKEVTEIQIQVVGDPLWEQVRNNFPVGEPGTVGHKALQLTKGSQYKELHNRIKDYLIGYQALDFYTTIPNVDIRHDQNFTGPRRGRNKTRFLEPWGTLDELMVK